MKFPTLTFPERNQFVRGTLRVSQMTQRSRRIGETGCESQYKPFNNAGTPDSHTKGPQHDCRWLTPRMTGRRSMPRTPGAVGTEP